MEMLFSISKAQSPIIATAIHDGHVIDCSLLDYMQLQDHERYREEDPYTAYLADLSVSYVTVRTSRFQTDLNRQREQAVYRLPEDAWGLEVWRRPLPEELVEQLRNHYDAFYREMAELIEQTIAAYGRFVVLDIHSYNHRRQDPLHEAPVAENPEVNIGTAHNQDKWQALCQRYIRFLSHTTIAGGYPDVRGNVKFGGGGFSDWISRHFGAYGCVLSIEFKKTFMDEWTGRVDIKHLTEIKSALLASVPCLLDALDI